MSTLDLLANTARKKGTAWARLCEAPNAMVELGQSKTNCHSYSCYLNETLLCIASNSWSVAVDACPAASRDWIKANQVLIKVTRSLWREACV